MIAPLLASLLFTAATIAPPPFVANSDEAEGALLHIGSTGIRCLRLPCPARAVFEPDARGGPVTPEHMLYTDLDGGLPPPPMIGDEAALAAIRTAWDERQCLAIEGRLISGVDDKPMLRVDRIVGPCRQQ